MSDPRSALIEAEGLATGYSAQAALTDVSFRAYPSEIVALLGPNGGGKTTLLRVLLGELPALEGSVVMHATAAVVPQSEDARLDLPVSALDVALMGAYGRTPWYRRLPSRDRTAAQEALARVGLASEADRPFGTLSRGQRQRVLIARALVQDARVLLLDEPFSGVDATSEQRIMDLLASLRKEGRLLLVATHDIEQARRWDRVLCLNRRLVAAGPAAEVLTAEVLQATYGSEIIVLDGGRRAVTVGHHDHDHGAGHAHSHHDGNDS